MSDLETWMRPYQYHQVLNHYRDYRKEEGTALGQSHSERFGQWWWNRYGGEKIPGIESCPEIFYERNDLKAINKIIDKFGQVG